jgi:cytochrome c oxidase subunit III
MPAPKLLWFNTGVLILSSVALQYAQVAARRGRMEDRMIRPAGKFDVTAHLLADP